MLKVKASVTRSGAILLGECFSVDGHSLRPARVVTHAHRDHLVNIEASLRETPYIVATPYTFELLEALGYTVSESRAVRLDYGSSFRLRDEIVTLLQARHIVGSAQVLVEGRDFRVGYTGDFKMPGTPPMTDLDVLVLDATYGSPHLERKWKEWDAVGALVDILSKKLREGCVVVRGYNGKLQEVMVELRLRGVRDLFLADEVTYKIARIAERFYKTSLEPLRVLSEDVVCGDPVVVFKHINSGSLNEHSCCTQVIVTGWELRAPAVEMKKRYVRVGLSDHASFSEILEYVSEARPRLVIVDGYRGRDAGVTAKYLSRVMGIDAIVMP
ncbi:MAG: MBL fold metallo-hydrolase [Acidilobaceae archaeon]